MAFLTSLRNPIACNQEQLRIRPLAPHRGCSTPQNRPFVGAICSQDDIM